jgi:alpha/beta superfamily hydrolase
MPAAVLLHPHPDMGGNQHNNVVSALYERLQPGPIGPIRFDFASSDLDAAGEQTAGVIEAAGQPVWLIGYSFGGAVAARIVHPAVLGWCLIAPALTLAASAIGSDPRPKHVIAAERDAWFGPDRLAAATADWRDASSETLAGADHFFAGRAAELAADLAARWIEGLA